MRSRSGKSFCGLWRRRGIRRRVFPVLVIEARSGRYSPQPQKILTGDTLFVGDVGRPDLAGGKGYTPPMMAGDDVRHAARQTPETSTTQRRFIRRTAPARCVERNMSKETSSTIGEQRESNYALQPMSKDEFVRMMTIDLPEAPAYFPRDAEINRTGAPSLAEVASAGGALRRKELRISQRQRLTLSRFWMCAGRRSLAPAHVPGAINIGLERSVCDLGRNAPRHGTSDRDRRGVGRASRRGRRASGARRDRKCAKVISPAASPPGARPGLELASMHANHRLMN